MTRSSVLAADDEVFYTLLDELFPDNDYFSEVAEDDPQRLPSVTGGAKTDDPNFLQVAWEQHHAATDPNDPKLSSS